VIQFTIAGERITEIDVTSDADRIGRFDVVILDDRP
jgi:hypothetical protein